MDSSLFGVIAIFVGAGCVAGFLAGLLGVGGGIIFVPVLTFVFTALFHTSPDTAIVLATSTSLACMIPTALSSCTSHYRKGNIDLSLIKRWTPWLLLGVICGTLFSSKFGGLWLSALFGFVIILSSLNMLFRAKAPPLRDSLPGMPGQACIPWFISMFSVMLGIGGGTLSVPILTACNFEPRKATGTAAVIGLYVAIPGAIAMLLIGQAPADPAVPLWTFGKVCLFAVLCMVPFSVAMAPLGAAVNKKIPPVALKRMFGILLILTGIKMLLTACGI